MAAIIIDPTASCEDCAVCGWNPQVAQKRLWRIRELAKRGLLHLWGVDVNTASPEDVDLRKKRLRQAVEIMREGSRR